MTDRAREDGEIIKCLIVRDWETKSIFGHCIPRKGDDEDGYVANLVASDVAWLGHTRVLLKGDNERALQAMIDRAIRIIRANGGGADHDEANQVQQVGLEEPPTYDSQANGGTERGVRSIRGLFRTLKLCTESRIGRFIPVTHALVPWLLMHTCLLVNVRQRGEDGLTPWTRVRGRPFNQRMLWFGECVLYKLPTKGPQSNPDGNMGTQWREAVFLGYSRNANTYIVGNIHGTVATRSLMRRPMDNRWSRERLAQIRATPWSERVIVDPRVRFEEPAEVEPSPPAPERAIQPRRFRINKADLERHGYTQLDAGNATMCNDMASHGQVSSIQTHVEPVCCPRWVNQRKASNA